MNICQLFYENRHSSNHQKITLKIPVIKTTTNYISIALVTARSKLFGMCIFTVKSIIKYYTVHNTPVYKCFPDASKAFDIVNHWTLFTIIITIVSSPSCHQTCVFHLSTHFFAISLKLLRPYNEQGRALHHV